MNILAVDLGTTNIKVSVYDKNLTPLILLSEKVNYHRQGDIVEFNPDNYFNNIQNMIREAAKKAWQHNGLDVVQIVFTGQAESLILLDENQQLTYPGISWLDMRSRKECEELASIFDNEQCYRITGQPEIIPTWPITKMLWLRKNQPEVFSSTAYYLMIKDYIVFRLSGVMAGDHSIYSFSHYFNITEKCYWQEILDYCGINKEQLPALVEPGTVVGTLLPEFTQIQQGLSVNTKVNIGTLDHFAAMIGTGNITEGVISESAGTVLSLATLIYHPVFEGSRLPVNCGPFPNSYVLLPVCESGGFSLEWYKNHFMPEVSFQEMNQGITERASQSPPIFLPYLTGVNAPDFNEQASGVFFGIHASHTRDDFSLAIMQGVACLLRKNIDAMHDRGIEIKKIISVGGGAKSTLWTQIKTDMTQLEFAIPENEEAACFGAAMMGAVSEGYIRCFEEAVLQHINIARTHVPKIRKDYQATYQVFTALYDSLQSVYALNARTRPITSH